MSEYGASADLALDFVLPPRLGDLPDAEGRSRSARPAARPSKTADVRKAAKAIGREDGELGSGVDGARDGDSAADEVERMDDDKKDVEGGKVVRGAAASEDTERRQALNDFELYGGEFGAEVLGGMRSGSSDGADDRDGFGDRRGRQLVRPPARDEYGDPVPRHEEDYTADDGLEERVGGTFRHSLFDETQAQYDAKHIETERLLRLPSVRVRRRRSKFKKKLKIPHLGDHEHHWTEKQKLTMAKFESADYDEVENSLWEVAHRGKTDRRIFFENVARWMIMFLIGLFTGSTAALIDYSVRNLQQLKFKWTLHFIEWKTLPGMLYAQLLFCGSGVLMVGFAGTLVAYIEPMAAGSGIPEIKAYLNGNKLPRLLRLKTVLCKVVGVIFAVSGGLYLGKEGPLVHTGAIVAAGISQGGKIIRWHALLWKAFLNDHDKRDFIAAGAAAGVSAAFGAPIGGVLFSLEEASSFWNVSLTWRTFFCSMVSTFTLNFWRSGATGVLNAPGLITFGVFDKNGYRLWELPVMALIAFFAGIYGAMFNAINARICKLRLRFVNHHRWMRLIEVLVIGFGTALAAFWTPAAFPCRPLSDVDGFVNNTNFDRDAYVRYLCDDGEYNDMATTIFASQEDSIHRLFHNSGEFTVATLIVFALIYFFFAVITYGIAVPSGLFVPCILSGCAIGRLCGHLLAHLLPGRYGDMIDPGTYALIGAVAMLGGVARMTLSLTVIMLETTNDIQYLLPIMLTLQVSKWVGDLFNESLYDIHIHLKCIPFLEHEPDKVLRKLTARDIMAKDVVVFKEIEIVENIVDALREHRYNGFPVIAPSDVSEEPGVPSRFVFRGVILRSQLVILLKRRVFRDTPNDDFGIARPVDEDTSVHLTTQDFLTIMDSKVPRIESVHLSDADMKCYVDLAPYMSPYPYIVYRNFPMPRVFRLFRTMGLRHLCVVDRHNEVVGIITRKDLLLAPEKLSKLMEKDEESFNVLV